VIPNTHFTNASSTGSASSGNSQTSQSFSGSGGVALVVPDQ